MPQILKPTQITGSLSSFEVPKQFSEFYELPRVIIPSRIVFLHLLKLVIHTLIWHLIRNKLFLSGPWIKSTLGKPIYEKQRMNICFTKSHFRGEFMIVLQNTQLIHHKRVDWQNLLCKVHQKFLTPYKQTFVI